MLMKPSPLIRHRKSDNTRLMPEHFLQSHKMHLQGALLKHMSLNLLDMSKLWEGKSRRSQTQKSKMYNSTTEELQSLERKVQKD